MMAYIWNSRHWWSKYFLQHLPWNFLDLSCCLTCRLERGLSLKFHTNVTFWQVSNRFQNLQRSTHAYKKMLNPCLLSVVILLHAKYSKHAKLENISVYGLNNESDSGITILGYWHLVITVYWITDVSNNVHRFDFLPLFYIVWCPSHGFTIYFAINVWCYKVFFFFLILIFSSFVMIIRLQILLTNYRVCNQLTG